MCQCLCDIFMVDNLVGYFYFISPFIGLFHVEISLSANDYMILDK